MPAEINQYGFVRATLTPGVQLQLRYGSSGVAAGFVIVRRHDTFPAGCMVYVRRGNLAITADGDADLTDSERVDLSQGPYGADLDTYVAFTASEICDVTIYRGPSL
jgi:hypothetical protein